MTFTITAFIKKIPDFHTAPHCKICLYFLYYLQIEKKSKNITTKMIAKCYDDAFKIKPTRIDHVLNSLASSKKIIRNENYYIITGEEIEHIGNKFLLPQSGQILKNLIMLQSSTSDTYSCKYIQYIINCMDIKAYPAVIVLTWIFTIDHIRKFILTKKLDDFNNNLKKNKSKLHINTMEDFEDIKDSLFFKIMKSSKIITTNQHNILTSSLNTRNTAAHPNKLELTDMMVISFIDTLITNIILKINDLKN